ncbi:MAG: glycosyltransferase [Pirellula sp.]|nr:glycosyltransferase [Pirellula sp.]
MRLRLDIVITELDTGGAETFCVELAKYLRYREHRVRVIALGPEPPSQHDRLYKELVKQSIETHFLGCRSVIDFAKATTSLKRLFELDPPEVVQSLLWHANVITAYALGGKNVPLIGGVRVADPRRWRFWFSRWSAKRMRKVVCVSRSIRDWCEQQEKISSERLAVISNGVDRESIRTRAVEAINHPAFQSNRQLLLFVGRLHEQKGIDVLIERGDRLLNALSDFDLAIVGDGPMRSRVDAYRLGSAYSDRIHVVGQSDQVPSWMRRSSLVILPTRYEGMPNVILEAMSLGKPVATMAVQGVEEVLGEQWAEQAVKPNEWPEWESLVLRLAGDIDRSQSLGEGNRERIETEFDLRDKLAQYESLYFHVIN